MKDPARREALKIIRNYYAACPDVFFDFEKQNIYKWALWEATRKIKLSEEPPLTVLEQMLAQYDDWAHRNNPWKGKWSVAAAAIDDIIAILTK